MINRLVTPRDTFHQFHHQYETFGVENLIDW